MASPNTISGPQKENMQKYVTDLDKEVMRIMKLEYNKKLQTCFSSDRGRRENFACDVTNQDFVNSTMQQLMKAHDKQYAIKVVNGKERLLKNVGNTMKVIIPWEDSFDYVWQIHKELGHPKPMILLAALAQKCLINRFAVECINEVCHICLDRRKPNRRCTLKVFPMVKDHTFDGIMFYEDLHTGFKHIRPLCINSMELEVSLELMKIFMDFGPPANVVVNQVLTKYAMSHVNELIAPLNVAITEILPDSDKTCSLKTMITDWMQENNYSDNWAIGCQVMQWELNNLIPLNGASSYSKLFAAFIAASKEDLHEQEIEINSMDDIAVATNSAIQNITADRILDVKDDPLAIDVSKDIETLDISDVEENVLESEIINLDENSPPEGAESANIEDAVDIDMEVESPKPGPSCRRTYTVTHDSVTDTESRSPQYSISSESIAEIIDLDDAIPITSIIEKRQRPQVSSVGSLTLELSKAIDSIDKPSTLDESVSILEKKCIVCDNDIVTTGDHTCMRCGNNVHLACGEIRDGSKIKCKLCIKLDSVFC